MNVAQVKNARVRMRTRVRRNLRPEFRCLKKMVDLQLVASGG